MSATFTFDTSGEVYWNTPEGHSLEWSDLSPFAQGYGEAMARTLYERLIADGWTEADASAAVAFSNWAPETLALILRDCERFQQRIRDLMIALPPREAKAAGVAFWVTRNGGDGFVEWFANHRLYYADTAREYPPLTPELGDDGKVYLREAARG